MTVPAVHCEARKTSYRQTKEGLVVSFVIHPNDMPDALAVAPLGQRYMLALCAIGDDEQPLPQKTDTNHDNEYDPATARLKSQRRIVPEPPEVSAASQRGKERYAASTEMQQALIRAARLPSDKRYQEWIGQLSGSARSEITIEMATTLLRRACKISSRTRIAEYPDAYERFLQHEMEFKQATGQMAEVRR